MRTSRSITFYLIPLTTAIELEIAPVNAQEVTGPSANTNRNLKIVEEYDPEERQEMDREQKRFEEVYQKERIRLKYLYRPPVDPKEVCAERLSTMR